MIQTTNDDLARAPDQNDMNNCKDGEDTSSCWWSKATSLELVPHALAKHWLGAIFFESCRHLSRPQNSWCVQCVQRRPTDRPLTSYVHLCTLYNIYIYQSPNYIIYLPFASVSLKCNNASRNKSLTSTIASRWVFKWIWTQSTSWRKGVCGCSAKYCKVSFLDRPSVPEACQIPGRRRLVISFALSFLARVNEQTKHDWAS